MLGIQRLAMAHRPTDDRRVRRRDVPRIQRLGRRLVAGDVAGSSNEDGRVGVGHRRPVHQPRHRRERVFRRPALVAIPSADLALYERVEALLRLEQLEHLF